MRSLSNNEMSKIAGGLFAGDAGNVIIYQINGGDLAGCAAAAGAAVGAGGRNVTADIAAVGACWNTAAWTANVQPARPSSPPDGQSQVNSPSRR
jgi:hypothetical protein